ncbi:molybdenum cofactor biosynthesis protein MoaE [Martelella lutilitoris]|uniref:Molybdopterin synthase catalytic subunit n=1 Tax=Martelella lutilitoris TaxID=2583532 RepID=A0A5C4JQJ3_9HYPH|nr:molybdenum cofactor biosynthesis protein MoaE [Martelella lutilitoris]TNB46939.1 molybdenum cofactor biosynthesis protein MoaE [Martelella lutilitoris]
MPVTLDIRIQADDFDIAAEQAALGRGRADIGALVSFTGLCRDENGRLEALELEHYPGMAESEITRIAETAIDRFGLLGLTAIHRHGRIKPGENIVLVIAAATHRQAAFDGATFVMDFLKTDAPFWKKEHLKGGGDNGWVEARERDLSARDHWQ